MEDSDARLFDKVKSGNAFGSEAMLFDNDKAGYGSTLELESASSNEGVFPLMIPGKEDSPLVAWARVGGYCCDTRVEESELRDRRP